MNTQYFIKLKFVKRYLFHTLVILGALLYSGNTFGQIKVVQYNAGWNIANDVQWLKEKKSLTDCKVSYVNIEEDKQAQSKNKIVIVPTIIIFNAGEEVKRYQADISFKLVATKDEMQEFIDELIMSDF
tara:strand:+ start:1944 stop:2327 length:384 start_codon:yes stop_codon:yes gene_type:complete